MFSEDVFLNFQTGEPGGTWKPKGKTCELFQNVRAIVNRHATNSILAGRLVQ
jgi:hypothetical protein